MRGLRNPGRVVGLWYLTLVLTGPLTLLYIPDKLFVHGNATLTAANIAAHQGLFEAGMLADLFGSMILIFLVFAFYRLFKDVDRELAVWLVVTGGIMPATLMLVNFVNSAGALMVAREPSWLAAFDRPQRDALVMLFVELHEHQITASEILWGVWLFPMGLLAYKSGFLPRFIGVWLVINGAVYVLLSVSRLLVPEHAGMLFNYAQPALFGELAIMLWLLVKGANPSVTSSAIP